MKRSELNLTGESYRVLNTRETSMIMTDESLIVKLMAEGLDDADYEPDKGDIDEVKIATDKNGKFYTILEPRYIRSSHEWINENLYKLCENPSEAYDGSFLYLESKWNIFEDEDIEEIQYWTHTSDGETYAVMPGQKVCFGPLRHEEISKITEDDERWDTEDFDWLNESSVLWEA